MRKKAFRRRPESRVVCSSVAANDVCLFRKRRRSADGDEVFPLAFVWKALCLKQKKLRIAGVFSFLNFPVAGEAGLLSADAASGKDAGQRRAIPAGRRAGRKRKRRRRFRGRR